jgi:hypothetical protein
MSRSSDLNARAHELARELNITYAEARRELARRGAVVRNRNVRMKRAALTRQALREEKEERMGLR